MPIKRLMDRAKEWLGFSKTVKAPPEAHAKFLLKYDGLVIGTLSVDGGVWRFEYSDEFKLEPTLRPIVEFPDINRVYENEDLWQFFASRIPSPEIPEVEEILQREHIAEDDAVSLLRRFGKDTIASPFQLEAAA